LWRRKSSVEIRDGLPLPVKEIAFNLVNEDVAAPSVLNSLLRVPNALRQSLYFVQNRAVMEPGQLCSNLLHKVVIRPSFGQTRAVLPAYSWNVQMAEVARPYPGNYRLDQRGRRNNTTQVIRG
jgi:hypothetical protein